jgi:hypothetical protein
VPDSILSLPKPVESAAFHPETTYGLDTGAVSAVYFDRILAHAVYFISTVTRIFSINGLVDNIFINE